MGKQKKKQSGQSLEKLKQLHHKNEFVKRIKVFATIYCGREASSLLTRQRLEDIYLNRAHTLKLLVANDSQIEPYDRKDIESFFLNRVKAEMIKAPDGSEVTLSDFLKIGLSLSMYIEHTGNKNLPADAPFLSAFALYKERYLTGEDVHKRLYDIGAGICALANNMSTHYFWINTVINFEHKIDGTVLLYVQLHRSIPEKAMFVIDGLPRPAVKVGWAWPCNGVDYIKLRPSELGLTNTAIDIPLDVYIQSHALQRLSERIDNINTSAVHFFLVASLKEPKIITDSHGKFLIELRLDKYKTGYLRAEIINGSILIRTFLFLTNNGTPEGKKLEQITGLAKLDKKYLAIDRLSSFMSSDIRSNESVMEVLRKTGCKYLLDLHQYMGSFIIKEKEFQQTGTLLFNYLSLNAAKDKEVVEPAM